MKIVLASNNKGKLAELQTMLAPLGMELVRQADLADKGHRTRMLGFAMSEMEREIGFWWNKEMFVIDRGGWGIPNSYQGRATTSVGGVAWFTSPNGCRYARVRASRVVAPKSSFKRVFAIAFQMADKDAVSLYDIVASVLPETALPETLLVKHEKGLKANRWPALKVALYRAILSEPLEPSHRAALADWYGEQGREHEAESCRRAIETVVSL